jgi:transposase, IS5 family
VSDAAVHDSQKLDAVLDRANTNRNVWADSAYRSAENEERLASLGYKPRASQGCARPSTWGKTEAGEQGALTGPRPR